jgi:subtilase family serine protease
MNRKALLTVVVLLVAVTAFALVGGAGAAPSPTTKLAGSVPSWATSANFKSSASSSAHVGFRVYLNWRGAAAATALAKAVSDPASPSYGKYLTPAQFRNKFAPSQSQVQAVQSWLKSQGFAVDYTPTNNHYVAAEGTVAQAEAAFATTFGMYKVKGKLVRSPLTALSVPSSLATIVSGVIGLDDSAVFVTTDHVVDKNAPPTAGFRNAPPLSISWADSVSPYAYPPGFTDAYAGSPDTAPWTVKGYTPAQIKGAYGISGDSTGAGQTVAIIDAYASPTILSDVNEWSSRRGLPTMSPSQLVQVVPPGAYHRAENKMQDPQGWWGEETLDVEAVHGMAPAAKIVFVASPNNFQDMDAAMNHVVDRHLANIVTNSYGWPTETLPKGYVKPLEDTLVQAAAEGIGVYFSSGDNGDETSYMGYATADWPASSPWVTAVGGTSLGIGSGKQRVLETGWGTSDYNCDTTYPFATTRTGWLYGSGGGVSRLFAEPWYQTDAGLSLTGRGVPDVAALGDPQTGLLVGQTQTFPDGTYYDEYRIGGTSLSSPIFAGLMALADEKAGTPHGFANPAFYESTGKFYDVLSVKTAVARRNFTNGVDDAAGTSDHLRTFDDYSGSLTQFTATGWDNVTGLGVPNGIFTP